MMTSALDHPAVRDYLQRLDAATAHLPADERVEISEGIRSHLIAALPGPASEADVRTALDVLGAPEEIVGTSETHGPIPPPTATPTPPPARTSARGGLEIAAVIFLLAGAIVVPLLGWVIGVVLLWLSKAWTTGEKLLGTVITPGGLALAPLLGGLVFGFTGPSGWAGTAVMAVFVIAPIAVAIYLLRVAGRRPAPVA